MTRIKKQKSGNLAIMEEMTLDKFYDLCRDWFPKLSMNRIKVLLLHHPEREEVEQLCKEFTDDDINDLIRQLRKQVKEKEYADPLMCGLVNRILADIKTLEDDVSMLLYRSGELTYECDECQDTGKVWANIHTTKTKDCPQCKNKENK